MTTRLFDLILEKDVFQSTRFVVDDLEKCGKWSNFSLLDMYNDKEQLLKDVLQIYKKKGYAEKYIPDLVDRFGNFIDTVLNPYRRLLSIVSRQEKDEIHKNCKIKDVAEYVLFFEAICNLKLSKELKSIVEELRNISGDKYSLKDYLDREAQCKIFVQRNVKNNLSIYEEFEKIIDKILNIHVVSDRIVLEQQSVGSVQDVFVVDVNNLDNYNSTKSFYDTVFSYSLHNNLQSLLKESVNNNTKNKTISDYNLNKEGFQEYIKKMIGEDDANYAELEKIVRVEVKLFEKKCSTKRKNKRSASAPSNNSICVSTQSEESDVNVAKGCGKFEDNASSAADQKSDGQGKRDNYIIEKNEVENKNINLPNTIPTRVVSEQADNYEQMRSFFWRVLDNININSILNTIYVYDNLDIVKCHFKKKEYCKISISNFFKENYAQRIKMKEISGVGDSKVATLGIMLKDFILCILKMLKISDQNINKVYNYLVFNDTFFCNSVNIVKDLQKINHVKDVCDVNKISMFYNFGVDLNDLILKNPKECVLFIVQSLLNNKDKYVITKRYGLNGGSVETLESISSQIGLTRERIRQIENKSIKKLNCGIVNQVFDSCLNLVRKDLSEKFESSQGRFFQYELKSYESQLEGWQNLAISVVYESIDNALKTWLGVSAKNQIWVKESYSNFNNDCNVYDKPIKPDCDVNSTQIHDQKYRNNDGVLNDILSEFNF